MPFFHLPFLCDFFFLFSSFLMKEKNFCFAIDFFSLSTSFWVALFFFLFSFSIFHTHFIYTFTGRRGMSVLYMVQNVNQDVVEEEFLFLFFFSSYSANVGVHAIFSGNKQEEQIFNIKLFSFTSVDNSCSSFWPDIPFCSFPFPNILWQCCWIDDLGRGKMFRNLN